jgi:1-deoxy-D-xylulose-5-phosphate reductoisomerase
VIGVAVLGSTGSIGESTLDVLARHLDRFEVVALAANRNAAKLAQQIIQWNPEYAVLADETSLPELKERVARAGVSTRILGGESALLEVAALPRAQYVMAAIVGAAGLRSTFAAANAGKRLLIANKESLVMAGPLLISAARASGAMLLPVDSEHSAIFQCLPQAGLQCLPQAGLQCPPADTRTGTPPKGVRRVLLTASGGPFLDWPMERLAAVTPEQACAHPNWVMGRKISVDSATLMNKGLELIEAALLFGLDPGQVDVVVHRQSIVHSLVEYIDGSVLAQLGSPDMRTPIAYALAWPERLASGVEFLDLIRAARLEFCAPDVDRFRCLALAQAAARAGGSSPAILNAANEVAVQAFLDRHLNFLDIARVSEAVLAKMTGGPIRGLDDVMAADAEARRLAEERIPTLATRAQGAPA